MSVAFVDCETTGLDPDRHDIWEIALIFPLGDGPNPVAEHVWQFQINPAHADPTGLQIGRYYQRGEYVKVKNRGAIHRVNDEGWMAEPPAYAAEEIARILDGRHMVGAVPSFDAAFLTRWLNRNRQAATWHYHLIDVEALAVGYLFGRLHSAELPGPTLPWNSNDLSVSVGVDPDRFDRHTALGDARWAKAIYEAVTG